MIPKSQLISLSEVPGMGPRRIRALLREFPELEDIANLSKSVLSTLLMLELKNIIQQHPGKLFTKSI